MTTIADGFRRAVTSVLDSAATVAKAEIAQTPPPAKGDGDGDTFVKNDAATKLGEQAAATVAAQSNLGYPLKTEPTLQDVASGKVELAKGAKGPAVRRMQEALELAGYKLPRYGQDGDFGSETQGALKRFQAAHHIEPANGRLDAETLTKLDAAAAKGLKSPEYGKLFKDGVLNSTLAIGYDEGGWHKIEEQKIVKGLVGDGVNKGQGYTQLNPKTATDTELTAAGIDPKTVDRDAQYFVKTFQHEGKDVKAVVKLITPDTPNAKQKFADAMANSEMVMYCGHGRYGSGPDFDDIKNPAGNFRIGDPFEKGHVTLGENDLNKTKMTKDYQLMMFSGCNTFRYFDDLRRQPGKTTKNLDIVGSTTELWWHNMGTNTLTMLDGVTNGRSMNEIQSNLDGGNREAKDKPGTHYFRTNGFQDN